MNNKLLAAAVILVSGSFQFVSAQTPTAPKPTTKISETLAKNIAQITDKTPVSRERREQAYAKLLEGQRHVWNLRKLRTESAMASGAQRARESFRQAAELDPMIAETYTALAELSKNAPPYDIEESILMASIAVRIDKNNFGGHLVLAQLYTFKSQLNRGTLDANQTAKAIAEWREIARLDPRNAESYAFLGEFYARTGKPTESIAELRKWVASAAPISGGFYSRIFRGESLLPENGSLKLGEALTKAGETREAVEILSLAVADEPDNEEAVELLADAVKNADEKSSLIAADSLKQAVYANPNSFSLIVLLAQVQAKAGKTDDAAKVLRSASINLTEKDENSAANLQTILGDIFFEKNRYEEAVKAYQSALTIRGIGETGTVAADRRDFAIRVFDKIIETYKKANRPDDAKAIIARARIVLGKSDLFSEEG